MADTSRRHSISIEDDEWFRSVPHKWRAEVLEGHDGGGRWDVPGELRSLYLAKPLESGVVEVYRHAVDPFPAMLPEYVKPRYLARVAVRVGDILDLTSNSSCAEIGLLSADLEPDIGDYGPCQEAALAAAHSGYHGVLAPAATGLGLTLAVFVDAMSVEEALEVQEASYWPHLPPDPRRESPASVHPSKAHPSEVLFFGDPVADPELHWHEHALCATTEPDLFFPAVTGATDAAKIICQDCTVTGLCLLFALEHREKFGIWGGLDGGERAELFE